MYCLKVVLYVSLVFIISIVVIKFIFALYFRWFISGRQGANYMTNKELNKRDNAIEDWSETAYAQGPVKPVRRPKTPNANANPNSRRSIFARSANNPYGHVTMASQNPSSSTSKVVGSSSIYLDNSASRSSFMPFTDDPYRSDTPSMTHKSVMSADTSYRGFGGEREEILLLMFWIICPITMCPMSMHPTM